MKITKAALQKIIKEEYSRLVIERELNEMHHHHHDQDYDQIISDYDALDRKMSSAIDPGRPAYMGNRMMHAREKAAGQINTRALKSIFHMHRIEDPSVQEKIMNLILNR